MATNQFEYADLADYPEQKFESFCTTLLRGYKGCKSVKTNSSKDGGYDIVLTDAKGNETFVECKTESKPIGVKHIREFDSVCFRNKVKGIYISKSGFSRDAVNLAEEVKIKLMDFGDICRLGDDIGTNVYHFAVEPPRMLDGKDIHSVKMVFDIAGPANFDVRVDGFEEYYECSKKSPLTITMHDGKHTLYFKSKGYKEVSLDVDLTDDVNVYVRQNWGLKGGLKYELEE